MNTAVSGWTTKATLVLLASSGSSPPLHQLCGAWSGLAAVVTVENVTEGMSNVCRSSHQSIGMGDMSNLHIYTAPGQPLTRHEVTPLQKWHFGPHGTDPQPHVIWHGQPYERFWVDVEPNRKFYCHSCGRKRMAKNLNIQVYYDGDYIFCNEKEYGRAPWFPFAYERICKGTSWTPPKAQQ